MGIVLDWVVNGDKIFQGVSEATLKKRYQLYLDLGKKWDQEKEKRNQPENEEDDLTRSTAQLIDLKICGKNSSCIKRMKREKKA